MISTAKLWERLESLSKSGTSGYFTQAEFNSNLYSVQYAILSVLCDNYESNQKESDFLRNHLVSYSGTTQASGKALSSDIDTLLSNYYRCLNVSYVSGGTKYPAYKIALNESDMYRTSPIRKADLSKQRVVYYFTDNNIQFLPESSFSFALTYCKKPVDARIAFTTQETEDNDYLVIDALNTVDIAFPEGLFNLFVYYMLEAMGIEMKESLLTEYSQLGINRTTVTDLK